LAKVPNQIQVEGNTDNRPIHTEEFPSNWELSAARAASVVHLMTRMGVNPDRMSAIGYGEHRPAADNDSEAGRAKNRRVTLVIMGMNGKPDQSIDLPGGG
jgi:chemotaxis protein MotB